MADDTCAVDRCGKPRYCRGWCRTHYFRWHRTGAPEKVAFIVGDDETRWRSYVDKSDGCWLWTGEIKPNGYGVIRIGGRNVYAHRYGYELHTGLIPEGQQIDHLCRVRHCVNPDHLEPVTQRENILRGEGLSARRARKTHCKRGHEFTPENTYRAPGNPNSRVCLTCVRARSKEKWREQVAAESS